MRRVTLLTFLIAFLAMAGTAQQAGAVCAKVTMQILQEVTLERVAFDAKMAVTNGVAGLALENIRVDVIIKDQAGNIRNDLFFVRPPALTGIDGALNGTGSIAGGAKGESHWLIIPSPGAGFIEQDGTIKQIAVDYWVGATLAYTVSGKEEIVPISPAKITVKPMPQLVLDYFMPKEVLGDNPFTPKVEPPIPYPLAVRVMNDGYGAASKLKIDSAQPKIVDNKQGLLIAFKILGTSVNDNPVTPSLKVEFGDVGSKKGATAWWQMVSTLSGKFIDFKAEFSHSSELGGELTSLLKATNPHYLTHLVKVNLPGRDSRLDFLADMNDTGGFIYESEFPGGLTKLDDARTPVTVLLPSAAPTRPTPVTPSVAMTLPIGTTGWVYTKLADPAQGMLKLLDVVRSDGVHLDHNNFWVDEGLDKEYKKTFTLQLLDYRGDAATTGGYTLTYTKPDTDLIPPSTVLQFNGPATGTGPYRITPQTQLFFTATDNEGGSGVESIYKKVVGQDADFVPAYPFNLVDAGTYTVQFYSIDRAGNVEQTQSSTVTVDGAAPAITAFAATPPTFSPQAPRGIAVARGTTFALTVTDSLDPIPVEIRIASGSTFAEGAVVRTLKGEAKPATGLSLAWDGRDTGGRPVALGPYTARLVVSDGLDNSADPAAPSHTATRDVSLTAIDWLNAQPVDPNPAAEQLHPRMSGRRVVWQDARNGGWDIYLKELDNSTVRRLTTEPADQTWPAIDGNLVVWQDNRSGNWDIYGFDLSAGTEFAISTEAGDQERPTVSGDWVVWQDNRSGNWDIYAYNVTTKETRRLTSHERDQLSPAISGAVVTWVDYRHGPAEIYRHDLTTGIETRLTIDQVDQLQPAMSGGTTVWTDGRNGQREVYRNNESRGDMRLTYGNGEHIQPSLNGDLLLYTDLAAGATDPNLAFLSLANGTGAILSTHPARQEESTVGDGMVAWQDNRDVTFQIYAAPLALEAVSIDVTVRPGMNLMAVGQDLASRYPTAAVLLAAKGAELGIEKLVSQDPATNTYTEATTTGGDFPLVKGAGILLYATKGGTLTVAASGETAGYTLLAGANQVGLLSMSAGYTAHDLMRALGLDNVQSLRRYDSATGSWQTVSVRTGGTEIVGMNYPLYPGDGVIITMKKQLDDVKW